MPLASAHARPGRVGRIAAHPGVHRQYAWRASRECHQGSEKTAGSRADPLCPRPYYDPRSSGPGSSKLRVLSSGQNRIRSLARLGVSFTPSSLPAGTCVRSPQLLASPPLPAPGNRARAAGKNNGIQPIVAWIPPCTKSHRLQSVLRCPLHLLLRTYSPPCLIPLVSTLKSKYLIPTPDYI